MTRRFLIAVLAAAGVVHAQRGIPSDWQAVMNRIRPDSVRGHLSFLASDVLEGRGMPSRGLEVAAEYIASQFRRAGLEPIMGAGYFQSLDAREAVADLEGFECRLYERGREVAVTGVPFSKDGIRVDREPLLPVTSTSVSAKDAVVVFRGDAARPRDVLNQLSAVDANLVIVVDPTGRVARAALRVPAAPPGQEPKVLQGRWLFVPSFPENLAPDARITVKAKPAEVRKISARNVAGLLRGSDPVLRDTYIAVSAHYDHEGAKPFGTDDRIYNGANDNASGVTAVLEMANSFAALPERPKRSIIFVAFAGEEDGMVGSREFVRNPPVPREKIVANINFEHLGRPDADNTSYLGKATVTGFDFTSIGPALAAAGRLSGFEFFKHEKFSDPFFKASDNIAFAEAGIPAHTVSNGFIFPEYHQPGDHWEKINIENMTGLVRALALGVLTVADDAHPPEWNQSNENTREFRPSSSR